MSACEQPLVYTTDPTDGPDELADFTRAIAAAADSPKEQRRLLAQKQLAIERLHPRSHLPARLPKPDKFLTLGGEDWREILKRKQRLDRIRRDDLVPSETIAPRITW